MEDEDDTDIPHFVADNISWWYPVDSKKINCSMLLRENKSLASAILDLGEQMQKMEQILWDFCKNYASINNPLNEVETRIDNFLTAARNVSNKYIAKTLQSAASSQGAQPASDSLSSPSSLQSSPSLSISAEGAIYPYTAAPHCCPTYPC